MADTQSSLSGRADTKGDEEADGREVATKAAVEREIAKWKAKELERLEKRQREKRSFNGRAVGDINRATGTQLQRYGARGPPAFNSRQVANEPLPPNEVTDIRPTWTRMARRHLSVESLKYFGLDYHIDQDPEYLLIHRWVPEPEQDKLWAHTRIVREQRPAESPLRNFLANNPPPSASPPPPNAGVMPGRELIRPTYTRMSRKHLSIETLRHFSIDFEIDQDPEYILIKKWVPESQQDELWAHTRMLRDQRRPEQGIRAEIRALEAEKAQLQLERERGGTSSSNSRDPSPGSSKIINGPGAQQQRLYNAQQAQQATTQQQPQSTNAQARAQQRPVQGQRVESGEDSYHDRIFVEDTSEAFPNQKDVRDTPSTPALNSRNHFSRFTSKRDHFTSISAPSAQGGLRIESGLSSTISRDYVMGEEARHAELLALYGKKKFSLAFRSPQPRDEALEDSNDGID